MKNNHLENAKIELHAFVTTPSLEHLKVAEINALISISEGIGGLLLFLNTQAKEDRKIRDIKVLPPSKN
ncbi:MAG: hypothetical protein DRP42_04675 [Tenericutes bacterium]|nr:MAG: hypothetical protein DRP42_04675 [Mycoplasmatota bacterium]